MKPFFARSALFNVCFFILTAVSCVILLPTLIMPRQNFMTVVHWFCVINGWLEKYILGLTYEVRGLENLPKEGSYIIAAKHQSAYETFKLHLLFNDPAIILKQELLKIPLWGKYLEKSDVIAINRSTPKKAIKSIQDGAKRVQKQGRPIIIFPQGTRVRPEIDASQRPYKIGVFRVQEATGLPIIPMALNTGVFYPKNSFLKKPGRVIFEFLPAIPSAHAESASETLQQLQMHTEEKANTLMEEGRSTIPAVATKNVAALVMSAVFLAAYIINWVVAAYITHDTISKQLIEIRKHPAIVKAYLPEPYITGFPGKMRLSIDEAFIQTQNGKMSIEKIEARSWPFLGMPVDVDLKAIAVNMPHWKEPLLFSYLRTQLIDKSKVLHVRRAALVHEKTLARMVGTIDFNEAPYPKLNLVTSLQGHDDFMKVLVRKKIVQPNVAMITGLALNTLQQGKAVNATITSDKNKVYLGPLKIFEFAPIQHSAPKHKTITPAPDL